MENVVAESTATGVAGLAEALKDILSLDVFMGALTTLVPVIGGVLIFAFIYGRVRKLTKGASNGKARI